MQVIELLSEQGSLLSLTYNACSLIPEMHPKFRDSIFDFLEQELILNSHKNKKVIKDGQKFTNYYLLPIHQVHCYAYALDFFLRLPMFLILAKNRKLSLHL